MDMQALQQFLGQMGGAMPAAAPVSPHLVEFKAGKCNLVGTTVTADPRKGKFVLTRDARDGMVHYQWSVRPSSGAEPEEDLIITPGDFSFEKVPECTTGRAYLLTSKPNNKRRFFWMQELSDAKDEEVSKKVQFVLDHGVEMARGTSMSGEQMLEAAMASHQSSASSSAAAAAAVGPPSSSASVPAAPSSAAAAPHSALPTASAAAAVTAAQTSAVSNTASVESSAPDADDDMDAELRLAMEMSMGAEDESSSSSVAAATPAAASSSSQQQQDAAANFLRALYQAQQQQQRQQRSVHKDVDLEHVLEPTGALRALLHDPTVVAAMRPHLPPGDDAPLEDHLASAPVRQAIQRLEQALQSAQMAAIMAQFGLPHTGDIGVGAFLRAIERQAREKTAVAAENSAPAVSTPAQQPPSSK